MNQWANDWLHVYAGVDANFMTTNMEDSGTLTAFHRLARTGLVDADSSEIHPDCKAPVIDILPEQKKIEGLGGNMRLGGQDVRIVPGTLAARLFGGAEQVRMRFRRLLSAGSLHCGSPSQ